MSTLHQACAILLSTCQQFCLVCCIPAYGWFAHWNWIVSWHCHFLAFSLGNLYLLHITHRTTRPTLSCRHWQYCFYASILHSATTWLIACSLSPNNQHKGETCCQLCAICPKSLVLYRYEHSLSLLPLGSCFSQFQVSWHLTSSVFLINCE